MANPGKKPLPTRLKIIKGTDQPCRMRKDEPKPKTDKLAKPQKLSPVADAQWDRIIEELRSAKLLTNVDTHALAMYCEAYATWIESLEKIRSEGVVVMTENGYPKQSPYFLIGNKAFDQMKALLVEFGMTPSSRTRVSAVDTDDDDF